MTSNRGKIVSAFMICAYVLTRSIFLFAMVTEGKRSLRKVPAVIKERSLQKISEPSWCRERGPYLQAGELFDLIQEAAFHGLSNGEYHLAEVEENLREFRKVIAVREGLDGNCLARLDHILSDTFVGYSSHLWNGSVAPVSRSPVWGSSLLDVDLASLRRPVNPGQGNEHLFKGRSPLDETYVTLRKYFDMYSRLNEKGGWPRIPEGPFMGKGDRGKRVVLLRNRLIATGELSPDPSRGESIFDDDLSRAVRRFQHRHGLDEDGIVGPSTLRALNVSVEERLRQIRVNLERWRWLPRLLGRRYILVNIANYELELVESGHRVLTMKTIVGKEYRHTPVFSTKMKYIVFNPYWNVPRSIGVKEIIPRVMEDGNYLEEQDVKIIDGWGEGEKVIDPEKINWKSLKKNHFPYRFRQEPGRHNPLGRIKFIFPNKYSVYIHDTPARSLFRERSRDFSHGCIRIEKPLQLAEYLLRGNPSLDRDKIDRLVESKKRTVVRLDEPITVHILYWTAWVDEKGILQFRNDVYGRDRRVFHALYRE